MQLSRLLYISSASHPMEDDELVFLLEQSRINNDKHDICGLLIYLNDCFMQVLEGDRDYLQMLYEKIVADDRNKDNILIFHDDIKEREFSKWSMGFVPEKQIAKLNPPELYVNLTDPDFNLHQYFSDEHFNQLCNRILEVSKQIAI